MINLPRIQSIVAPLAAPAAPAVLLANEIYRTMVLVDIAPVIAMTSAVISLVATDFSGALMCHNAVKAWQRRSIQLMRVSIIGAIVYAIIVMVGIASMPEERGRIFAIMVLLTLVAYTGYAIYTAFEDDTKLAQQTAAAELAQANAELARLEKERLLINAQTRQIKAGGAVSNVQLDKNGQIEQQNGQTEQRITAAGQRIIDYLNTNGDGASLREIAEAVGVKSPSTVSQWLSYWRARQ